MSKPLVAFFSASGVTRRLAEKQLEAMKMAGVHMKEPDIYEMVNRYLLRVMPDKE